MTISLEQDTLRVEECRAIHLAKRPISFEQFLDMTGEDDELELVNGVLVERMSVSTPHEQRFGWLHFVLSGYVEQRGLGRVFGSRTAVKIHPFGARLPDILFVRADRISIIGEQALYGAPDLVIELVSPNDRPSDLRGLEADYRNIGVEEIVFLDAQKREVQVLRRDHDDYAVEVLTSGSFHSSTVPGFHFEVEGLSGTPYPAGTITSTHCSPRRGPTTHRKAVCGCVSDPIGQDVTLSLDDNLKAQGVRHSPGETRVEA